MSSFIFMKILQLSRLCKTVQRMVNTLLAFNKNRKEFHLFLWICTHLDH